MRFNYIESIDQSFISKIESYSISDFQENFPFDNKNLSRNVDSENRINILQDNKDKNNPNIFFKAENILSIFSPKKANCDNNYNLKETEAETSKKKITKRTKNNNNIISKAKIKRIIKKANAQKKKRNRIKNIARRKDNTDNIRKKFLKRFFKFLIKNINDKLALIGIKKHFKFLPEKFVGKYITEILKEEDKSKVDFTFGQLISKNIFALRGKEKLYEDNLKVLNCLKNSNINIFEKKKFSQLLGEYLNSKEFSDEKFDKKNIDEKYIVKCKIKANQFLNIFNQYYGKK